MLRCAQSLRFASSKCLPSGRGRASIARHSNLPPFPESDCSICCHSAPNNKFVREIDGLCRTGASRGDWLWRNVSICPKSWLFGSAANGTGVKFMRKSTIIWTADRIALKNPAQIERIPLKFSSIGSSEYGSARHLCLTLARRGVHFPSQVAFSIVLGAREYNPGLCSRQTLTPQVKSLSCALGSSWPTGTANTFPNFEIGSLRCCIASDRLESTVSEVEKMGYEAMERYRHSEPALGFARYLWRASQREACCALYHPFVIDLAAGTLLRDVFEDFIAQDRYFLESLGTAYGLAIDNTDESEEKIALESLKSIVREELDDVKLGLPGLTTETQLPNPATIAYTDFLLGVATGKNPNFVDCEANTESHASIDAEAEMDLSRTLVRRKIAAYTVAAMTPCPRLYTFLGQEIQAILEVDASSHPYYQWIHMHSSPAFGLAAVESEKLLHRLAEPFQGECEREAMEKLYRRAVDFEVERFDAQEQQRALSNSARVPVPLFHSDIGRSSQFVFVSDFDSTCTVSDSCPALADLSVATAGRENSIKGPSSTAQSLRRRWDSLVDQYDQDYNELLDASLSTEENNLTSQPRPFNPGLLRQVLGKLAELEVVANARVVDSGVLQGLVVEDVTQAGGSIPLREGCKELLGRISESSLALEFHVVSVCWSRAFVEGSFLSADLKFANIHSNELEFDIRGRSTGNILRIVQTAMDKETVFLEIQTRGEGRDSQEKRVFVVYLGDSVTDLLCLLKADIGIVIGESSGLRRVADVCGITLQPLYSGVLQRQQELVAREQNALHASWTKRDGVLYTISSWHELHAFLLGH